MRAIPVRRILRWAGTGLGLVLVLGLAIHIPPIRGWLGAHGHHGGGTCPFGYGPQGASTHAATKRQHDAVRGVARAQIRPALGFELDVTTAADLMRWATAHGVTCASKHGGSLVECSNMPLAALNVTSAWFQFGEHGTLASIRTVRRDHDVAPVSAAFTAQQAELDHAGTPTARDGSAAPAVLSNGTLRQAMVEYRFTNYRALLRATNMGDGFVLSEEYATLVD